MGMEAAPLGFALVCAAGLSTGLGASVVFSSKLVSLASKSVLAGALGISAGVMLYVSFVEIMVKANGAFVEHGLEENDAYLAATASVFGGVIVMYLLDALVHRLDPSHGARSSSNPDKAVSNAEGESAAPVNAGCCMPSPEALDQMHKQAQSDNAADPNAIELEDGKKGEGSPPKDEKLQQMGLMTALAIGLHNFPEGLATFVATLDDPAVGAALAIAIAIHNIPEGLCVSVPIYFSTGNRWKAFGWALLSGISEPIAAGLGWLFLKDHVGPLAYGILFGLVTGMMAMICFHELIPTAHRYDPDDKYVTKCIVIGMAIMALSLILFVY